MLAVEPAVALDFPAQALLRLLDHALGLAPLSPRGPARGLGAEPWRVGADVVLDLALLGIFYAGLALDEGGEDGPWLALALSPQWSR